MPSGLRERKKAETRQAISTAALALALEHGPQNVTVDAIAAAADVSPRTVFNYFATKEEAIVGVSPDSRAFIVDRLHARPDTEVPFVALREALRSDDPGGAISWRSRARLAREHPQLQSAYVAGFSQLEDELAAAVAQRIGVDPSTDPYPRLVVAVTLAVLRVAVQHAVDIDRVEDVEDLAEDAFDRVAEGLAARARVLA